MEFKYVIINEKKIPQHVLDITHKLEDVKSQPNLAVLVEEPYVVVDVDDMEQAGILFDIIEQLQVKCNIMKTDRGLHFWFKSPESMTNVIHANTPITIKVDIKSWGKKSLITVKRKGEFRDWVKQVPEVEELPFWLYPISHKKDLIGLGDGDGRDDGLYTYIIPLIKEKLTKEQIRIVFDIINKFLFRKPLQKREIDKMFDNNNIFDQTISFFEGRTFLHDEFAKYLKHNYPIESYNGGLYLYKNGVYAPNTYEIEQIMIEKIPRLTSNQRNEVYKYIEILSNGKLENANCDLINCLSGMIDPKTGEMLPHDKRYFSINQIPVYYNPGHYDKVVDMFLNSMLGNDTQLRLLIEEIMGYCLLNNNYYQKAFILLGNGANGKSVFLRMLTEFLGHSNVSSLSLEELDNRFKTAELVGKIANLGDDISADLLADSSMFKKLVSGEKLTVERKYGQPFQFNNRSKIIFSANTLPPTTDKSYGLERRLVIVPLLNKFTPDTEGYDPRLIDKLTTDSGKMYILDIALTGLKRLIEQGEFTKCDVVDNMIKEYVKDNNNVIQWLGEEPEIEGVDINHLYRNYCLFVGTFGMKPFAKTRFIKGIEKALPMFRLKNTTRNGKFMQVFKKE